MTLKDRVNRTKANSFEAQCQSKHLRREVSRLREEYYERLHELRVASMKHMILIAEIKRNRLLADRLCLPDREAGNKLCGLPIQ